MNDTRNIVKGHFVITFTHRLFAPFATRAPRSALACLLDADGAWRDRRRISRLSRASMQDIGLTPEDLRACLNRSVWDAPAHERR